MLQQLAPLQRALPLLVFPLLVLPLLVLLPLQLQARLRQAHQMVPLELESLHRHLLVGARLLLRLRVKQSLHRPL